MNASGYSLMVGGEIIAQTTSQVCAEMCAYSENMSDCDAVEYYYYTGSCVVHWDENDKNLMVPHPGADVYVMIRCNETGTAPSACHVNATRLPSSLRPTTRECVHLVTRGHFRSRYKDGGHTIRSVISENPMVHANFLACLLYTSPSPRD